MIKKRISLATTFIAAGILAAHAGLAQAYDFEVGNTKASIKGYIKLDMIYDVNENLGDNFVIPQMIKLSGPKAEGETNFHANQSRIAFTTSTPLEGSTLETMFEWDMFGSGGSSPEPRLRHAYGSWNGITAGQTWTNFVSDGALGQMRKINFLPEPGTNPARQAQLRYSRDGFSIALEDPLELGGGIIAPVGVSADRQLPDLTARYQGKSGNLNYAAAAVVRTLGYDTGSADDMAVGWGFNLEGAYKASNKITLRATVKYGNGIGGYIANSPAAKASAYIDPVSGDIHAIKQIGAAASISIAAGPGAINLGYGMAQADMDDAVADGAIAAASANEKFTATHLNYIWSAAKNVRYGAEVGYHTREVQSGDSGSAVRLQGMVQYLF